MILPHLYRTVGQQSVPLIVRTRGHCLEGIWCDPYGRTNSLIERGQSFGSTKYDQAAGFTTPYLKEINRYSG